MSALLPILLFGFFLGMRHATDSDHVVAVTTIVSRQRNIGSAAWTGIFWGIGHSLTLLAIGGAISVAGIGIVALVGSQLLAGTSPAASGEPTGSAAGAASAQASAVPVPGHEVYGFIPYWEMDDTIVAHLATTDLTTVALFSVTHSGKGGLVMTQNGARKINGPIGQAIIADAHARHRRVDVVYTSFGATKIQALRLHRDPGQGDRGPRPATIGPERRRRCGRRRGD
jgi:hypothetical protein